MSAMKDQDWVELSITLTSEDIQSLQVSAYWSDLSGVIEHILTLARDKQGYSAALHNDITRQILEENERISKA